MITNGYPTNDCCSTPNFNGVPKLRSEQCSLVTQRTNCNILAYQTIIANLSLPMNDNSALVSDPKTTADNNTARQLDRIEVADEDIKKSIHPIQGSAEEPDSQPGNPDPKAVQSHCLKARLRPVPPIGNIILLDLLPK
jgi:hypothetical protein